MRPQHADSLHALLWLSHPLEQNAETAAEYDIYQMPTFVFIKNNEVIHQVSYSLPLFYSYVASTAWVS
jgi:hypothetical protein